MRLTQNYLKSILHYDPDTGDFTNKTTRGRRIKISGIAGTTCGVQGYRRIRINGKQYRAHRLAFLWMTGQIPTLTDHINGVRDDNRWENLRSATSSENSRNAKRSASNISGCTGVYFNPAHNHWMVQISINGKATHLGVFAHIFDAACARKSAELKHRYHPNHGR